MRKAILIQLLLLLFATPILAQETSLDKSRVTAYFQNQEFEEAINYLQPLLGSDSTNPSILGYLGFAHSMINNDKQARKYYKQLYSYDTNSVTAIQYLAYANERFDAETAMLMSRKMAAIQPGKSAHFRRIADLLMREQEPDSAFSFYKQAYSLAPDDYRNAAGLSNYFLNTKQYLQADSILAIGLQADSMNAALLKIAIRSANAQEDHARVTRIGEKIMQLDEANGSILAYVALAYYNLKKYDECTRINDYMILHDLETEAVYYYCAKAYARLGQFDKSNELLEICISKSISKNVDLYYTALADNHESQLQFSKAISFYDTAYYLSKDPLAYYNMGRVYESNMHDPRQARKYYTRFVGAADANNPELKQVYQYAKERLDYYKVSGKK